MTADRPVAPPVALVGAGPGHLDLLTLDAEAVLLAAREVVADRSLAPLLRALAGASPGHPATFVDDDAPAPDALASAVGRGPGVVRLYRGDPWAHPAGDAERAALRAEGLTWATVPGVLSELAALAAAGVPAQVRDLAVTTTFLVDDPTLALAVPADPAHTLVVRTTDLAATAARLVRRAGTDGVDLGRPVALLPAAGTDPMRTTLAGLGARPDLADGAAGVLVVGLVAALDLRAAAAVGAER